jgi:hypothetical protein
MGTLKRLMNWVNRILGWLQEAYKFWLALFFIPAVPLICYAIFSDWKPRIRVTVMLLELAGLATVALGLRDTGTLFARKSFSETAQGWTKRFTALNNPIRIHSTTGNLTGRGALTVAAIAHTATSSTVEERVAKLEVAIEKANGRIDKLNKNLRWKQRFAKRR